MNPSGPPVLKKSRFTEFIVQLNKLDESGFQEWFFHPGMLFNSMDKWWDNEGRRDKPHEGLDLCFYKNRKGPILHLDEYTKIPVLYDGEVVRVMDDFMGKSVVVKHPFATIERFNLITIYGHTIPLPHLTEGRVLEEGDIAAILARPEKSQNNVPPHLHLSVGWISDQISYENLEWKSIRRIKGLHWVDPLLLI